MRQIGYLGTIGTLAIAVLIAQGCASQSGSGAGTEQAGHVEQIGEQPIKEIDPTTAQSALEASTSPSSEVSDHIASGSAGDALNDVLFDFDRDTIREEALPVLELNANRLKQDGTARILLEGRGDEIGTSAYNLVLGERRALRVKRYLEQSGLTVDLRTTSYGKDRPLCAERTSECMQMNRSVRFVIKK
ncbi:MAG: OmpA family protein [Nitrospira sp.]|nr:OmpA family protein [Nitrospira sp.]